jgi:NAD+ synthase
MVARTVETGLPLVYLNLVGGQDDQVFDGASFVLNPGGRLAVQMPFEDAALVHVDFEETEAGWRARRATERRLPDEWEADYRVMVEGLRDYSPSRASRRCCWACRAGSIPPSSPPSRPMRSGPGTSAA